MRIRLSVVLACACALMLSLAGTAVASGPVRPPAEFLTPSVEKKLDKKGAKGVHVAAEALKPQRMLR